MRVSNVSYNYNYFNKNKDNPFKIERVHKIDKHATTVKREYQEIKNDFDRILEQEKKYK